MKRSTLTVLLVLTALLGLGCLGEYEVSTDYGSTSGDSTAEQASGRTPDSPPPPPSSESPPMGDQSVEAAAGSPAEQPVAEEPAGPAASSSQPAPPRAAEPTAGNAGPTRPAPARLPSIRLSAGVALPQSLPTGTAMGFSADYRFVEGEPSSSSPYFWVIQPSKGQPVKLEVRLKREGTLPPTFVQQFRPEHGPFQGHIEDGEGNRLSQSIPLR